MTAREEKDVENMTVKKRNPLIIIGDDDEEADEKGVDRQLVRMGYRFLVRGCKGL